jgi:hypothetical protein
VRVSAALREPAARAARAPSRPLTVEFVRLSRTKSALGARLGAQEAEQAAELGDGRAAAVLDRGEPAGVELRLGGHRVRVHGFDGAADDRERLARETGALLRDDLGGERGRVACGEARRGGGRGPGALGVAPHEPPARPDRGEDERDEHGVGGGEAVGDDQRERQRPDRRVRPRAGDVAAERVDDGEAGGERGGVLLGHAGGERGERDGRDRQGRGHWAAPVRQRGEPEQRRERERRALAGEEDRRPRRAHDRHSGFLTRHHAADPNPAQAPPHPSQVG